MEIQVGEYVRTKYGIAKYIDVEIKSLGIIVIDKDIAHDHTDDYKNVITPEEILKHSFNIIDLIEEGDFVNDKKVKINYKDAILFEDDSDIVEQQIRKIVTHEQMEAMEYEVK